MPNDLLSLQRSPRRFRDALTIDTASGPVPFAEVIEDWQRDDFLALDGGWHRSIGQDGDDGFNRAWLERPRGHSKTADLAVMAAWALFASRKQINLVAAAADRDQAGLLRDAVARLCRLNGWLGKLLEVQSWRVINTATGSVLDVLSSDAPSSYGNLADGILVDEIVHHKNRDLWDSLLSSAAKRSNCMLCVITNAGLVSDEWVWTTREAVRNDARWYFSRLDGPCASWIDDEMLAEQQRLLPTAAYRRLWLNQWSVGSDVLELELIETAFKDHARPMTGGEKGYLFVAGLDLGLTRDGSAVVVLAVPESGGGRIRLADHRLWRPPKGGRIDLLDVEHHILELDSRLKLSALASDPWQAEALLAHIQRNTAHRPRRSKLFPNVPGMPGSEWIKSIPPTAESLRNQAHCLIQAFTDRRLELFECPPLLRDLKKARIVEYRTGGFRIESPRDADGHGDSLSAFSLALVLAADLAGRKQIYLGFQPDEGEDPAARVLRDFEERRARHQQEQQELVRSRNDDEEPWREMMQMINARRGYY